MNIFSATGLDDFSALSFRSVDAICGEDAPLETGHCQPAPDVNFAPAESTELALSLSFPSTQFWDFLDLDFPTPNATEASTSTENNPTDAPNSAPERVVETSSTKIKAKRPRGASLHCEERRSKVSRPNRMGCTGPLTPTSVKRAPKDSRTPMRRAPSHPEQSSRQRHSILPHCEARISLTLTMSMLSPRTIHPDHSTTSP